MTTTISQRRRRTTTRRSKATNDAIGALTPTKCRLNKKAIELWRKKFLEGVRFKKQGMAEDLGLKERKEKADKVETKLGVTTRGGRSRCSGGSSVPSATSSGKRKRLDVELEV
jgi:hypothetical protein